jgi:acyl transferase domain-containing protein/acyl carrier protein
MNHPVVNQDISEGIAMRTVSATMGSGHPQVVFMFPGQGSQYVNMGINLYRDELVFRSIVDRSAEILAPLLGVDLRSIIYPTNLDAEAAAMTLAEIRYTQPALFVVEYALAQLWQSWGVIPHSTIGHSIGEFVSGCVGGVFSLEDALKLVAIRSQMVWDSPAGSMLSVRLPAAELAPQLSEGVVIAAINGPALCVVAGETAEIEALQTELATREIVCRLLHTSHAFHSPMMDPIVSPFVEIVKQVKLAPPHIPFISSVTGDWISDLQATDPLYWATQLREPVQFALGIQTIWQHPGRVLLEVGTRRTTATLARQQAQDLQHQIAISSLNDAPENEWKSLFQAMRQLWLAGVAIRPDSADREEIPSPESVVATSKSRLINLLQEMFTGTSGLKMTNASGSTTFLELGLDSLSLTQAGLALKRKFQIKVTLRQLVETYPTFNTLADFLIQTGSPDLLDLVTQQIAIGTEVKAIDPQAKLGRDRAGNPAWFIPDPDRPGKYLQVESHE